MANNLIGKFLACFVNRKCLKLVNSYFMCQVGTRHVILLAIQVLRNADGGGGGGVTFSRKKPLRRCNVQCY